MVLGIFQPQIIKLMAEFLQSLIERSQSAGIDDHLRCAIDTQHCWYCCELFLQCVALCDCIGEIKLQTRHRSARLIEPADALVSGSTGIRRPVGNNVRVLLRQLGPPLLDGTQLVSIRSDFTVEETLRIVHLGSAASGYLLGKDRQQRLDDVLRCDRIPVAIRQGQQIERDRRHRDISRQSLEQRLLLFRGGDANIEIGKADQLFEIRAAQQRALHEIELAGRVGISGQPLQQRRQQRIGIEVNSRRGFVFRRNKGDADPSDGADEPSGSNA